MALLLLCMRAVEAARRDCLTMSVRQVDCTLSISVVSTLSAATLLLLATLVRSL